MMPCILMYHGVGDDHDEFTVSKKSFRQQLEFLIGNGFRIVSLQQIVERGPQFATKATTDREVAITFDDGYDDFAINALPILEEFKAPVTLFVVTGKLGRMTDWGPVKKRLLSRDELMRLKSEYPLLTLGSHSHDHVNLTDLSDVELSYQIRSSFEVLHGFGERFLAFSYPWGAVGDRESAAVSNGEFHCAVDTEGRRYLPFNGPFRLGRLTIHKTLAPKDLLKNICQTTPPLLYLLRNQIINKMRRRFGL